MKDRCSMVRRREKKTKIICTIGPATLNLKTIRRMYEAGMDAIRINTAHGDFNQYKEIINITREVGEIPVIMDIKGPEIRTRIKSSREARVGDVIVAGIGDEELNFSYNLYDEVDLGDKILVDNGAVGLKVVKKEKGKLYLQVFYGGIIENNKGVNIPHKRINAPSLSQKDLEVIEFSKENDAEFIALSFTRDANDLKNLSTKIGTGEQAVIAKIENYDGVKNIAEIIEESDAIMVARGDLGVEIDYEKVPVIQKDIIRRCNQLGKVVITATQMLESMVNNPTPTRAEASDVANAILDGSDAVMLSGETSIGKYPVECVEMMTKIAREAERMVASKIEMNGYINISQTVSKSINLIANSMPIDKIVTITRSGYTARMIARFRLKQPIIAVTDNEMVKRQLEIIYGVEPVHIKYREARDIIYNTAQILKEKKLIEDKDNVLFTAGIRTGQPHESNLIEIHKIADLLGVSLSK
ncbi:MAG: pyruvate kinase [Candidatus Jordarchaeum sp.]|uniref:pyruvate kinase n=1 Tax=Candidatus Jordarchaeum sp. TaxID=2823881 RepID=UPI00404A1366